MSRPADEEAALPPRPRRGRGRRAAIWLGVPLAGIAMLAALMLAFLAWALHSDSGGACVAGTWSGVGRVRCWGRGMNNAGGSCGRSANC